MNDEKKILTNNHINYSHSQTSITSFNQLPTFTTANKLIISDKFRIDLSKYNKNKKLKIIELVLGDKICIVKPSSNLVCETIVRGHLPKRHGGLESPSVYVLIVDNKFDFYNIVEIAKTKYKNLDTVLENTIVIRSFTIDQLAEFLIMDLQKDIKKFKSIPVIIMEIFLRILKINSNIIPIVYKIHLLILKEVCNDYYSIVSSK